MPAPAYGVHPWRRRYSRSYAHLTSRSGACIARLLVHNCVRVCTWLLQPRGLARPAMIMTWPHTCRPHRTAPVAPLHPLPSAPTCTCCSNAHDRLAFAVHAAICNTGFGLVGLGDDAQLEGAWMSAMCARRAWSTASAHHCNAPAAQPCHFPHVPSTHLCPGAQSHAACWWLAGTL